jgi:hypothetical protein
VELLDNECVKICDAINKIGGLQTYESCCGHGKDNFCIYFIVDDLENLPILLYFCDLCHVGFQWDCIVTTDCSMAPVSFRLESHSKGSQAYQEANTIAEKIMDYLNLNHPQDREGG